MDRIITIIQLIMPIFVAVFLGVFARRKQLMKVEEVRGLQQFVMKFGLPCVIFNSCLTADIGVESLGTMALVIPFMTAATLWAFQARKARFPYHNLPQLFCAQETGMLGIPLFMILFGTDQAYRMGILDLAQAITAYPTIAILSASTGSNLSAWGIFKNVLTSPLLIMSALGLTLNLTGIGDWMNAAGIGGIITESTGFLAQPVSAMMIFSVGYNFSLSKKNRAAIFQISTIHFIWCIAFGLLIQLGLCLIPNVDTLTRWSILMFSTLPASYLAPTLGRTEEDFTVASGVCSILTIISLIVFCIMAIFAS